MNELALFAGAGGGILGGKLLGWNTIGAVEIEEYPRKVLLQRQLDGLLGKFPIWDDIRTFDGRPWKGAVDIITGGFPCQDISSAGKGAGIEGERSGLWGDMARVVREVSPRFVFVENSPVLTSRGLHRVLGDLAEMGYDARWCVLGADDTGAPHRRKRIWILGYSALHGQPASEIGKNLGDRSCTWWDTDPAEMGNTESIGWDEEQAPGYSSGKELQIKDRGSGSPATRTRGAIKPRLGRVAHWVANRVDRLKAIGNGQVPAVAALAFTILSEGLI